MTLLPSDIVLINRGTGWAIFAPFVWLWQWMTGPYHVEMVWEQWPTVAFYRAFSLQPPVLDIVPRKFADLKITVFRLRERPEKMNEMFWHWGNEKIGKELYILGWQTCGHPVRDFYRQFGIEFSPYPGPIEKFCRKSPLFIQIV